LAPHLDPAAESDTRLGFCNGVEQNAARASFPPAGTCMPSALGVSARGYAPPRGASSTRASGRADASRATPLASARPAARDGRTVGSRGNLSHADASFARRASREAVALARASVVAFATASGAVPSVPEPDAADAAAVAEGEDAREPSAARAKKKRLPSWYPMHDFCLTLPWGLFVALAGFAGFAIAGSTKSLVFGGGFGALLIALGVQSLSRWKRGKGAVAQTLASLVVSAALAFVMGKKWLTGGSFVPSGIVFVGGVCMCLFYAQNIATGGNPPRESKED
jgi:hypothetical protein